MDRLALEVFRRFQESHLKPTCLFRIGKPSSAKPYAQVNITASVALSQKTPLGVDPSRGGNGLTRPQFNPEIPEKVAALAATVRDSLGKFFEENGVEGAVTYCESAASLSRFVGQLHAGNYTDPLNFLGAHFRVPYGAGQKKRVVHLSRDIARLASAFESSMDVEVKLE